MTPDLTELQVLDGLLRDRSLTRTADRLGMSQPSVSRVLARLRQHFGDPLFVRAGQKMEPTVRALELGDPVAAVLAGVRALQGGSAQFDPLTAERCFRLYMVDGAVIHVLPRLLRDLADAAPGVSIRTVQCGPRELEHKLEQGRIDLVLGSFTHLLNNIHQRPLWLESYATVMRNGHARARELDRETFMRQKHVLVTMGDQHHDYAVAARILESLLPPSAVLCHVASFTAAAHVVRHTDAVATLPRRLADDLAADLGLEVADVPLALPSLQLALYWHERCHRDPANQWLRRRIRDVLGKTDRQQSLDSR
jgi:DNA-binding transcriptional LysR family regulator